MFFFAVDMAVVIGDKKQRKINSFIHTSSQPSFEQFLLQLSTRNKNLDLQKKKLHFLILKNIFQTKKLFMRVFTMR